MNKVKLTLSNIITFIKVGIVGFLIGETTFISRTIAPYLNDFIESKNLHTVLLIISFLYLVLIMIYAAYREFLVDLLKVIKSRRLDLAIVFLFGLISNIYTGGIGTHLYKYIISFFTINQLLILVAAPFVIMFTYLIHAIQVWILTRNKKEEAFFISDTEQISTTEDLLNLTDEANRFAERVINQGSADSLVFGIDGPWGVGKSTFVNFCKEYWQKKYEQKIIVYVFNPLRYENRENLLEKFIDGLILTIQKHVFIPELKPIISRYSQFIRSVKGSLFKTLDLEVFGTEYSADDAFEDLELVLSSIDRKIIVVIDDLDRLNLPAVKDLLFTIKKSFTLPNVSYILCYDAENINSLEQQKPDTDKITEFLEKFINVKVSLYLNSDKLINYLSINLEKLLSGNSQADPILISKAIGGLKDIIKSNDYHNYVSFIGDIRKIKRLINTILLLDIEKIDFDNSDINSQDLIHLLLIYINYPAIFRKIYNTETSGKKGFFSLVSLYEDGYPESKERPRFNDSNYENSTKYTKYVKDLSSDNQRFILNKVFKVSERLENAHTGSVQEEIKTSYACFNGDGWSSGNRNLEGYLNAIVQASKPQTADQYKFYLNKKNSLLEGVVIEKILEDGAFSFSKSEASHKQLWKIIVNSSYEFNHETGNQLISYLVNNIPNYSLLASDDIEIGIRKDLSFYLVKLLDQAGWIDGNNKHKNNFDEEISEIAEWVLGFGRHKDAGIIRTLAADQRGILGLYDMLAFRLYCSADRGSDIFNLTRSLAKHGDANAPSDGSTKTIAIEEMREMSQIAFEIFSKQYIKTKKNIFELVNKLDLKDLTGKYTDFIEQKMSDEIKEVERMVGETKYRLLVFIIYQLGSSSLELGIPCGYYDPKQRNDQQGIRALINDYLFKICFNPGKAKDVIINYEYFLDYLLINLTSSFESVGGRAYIPHINEFTKVLDKEKLYQYWKKHRNKIKLLNLQDKEKLIYTVNYNASYKEDLPDIYKTLDDFITTQDTNNVSQKPNESDQQTIVDKA